MGQQDYLRESRTDQAVIRDHCDLLQAEDVLHEERSQVEKYTDGL